MTKVIPIEPVNARLIKLWDLIELRKSVKIERYEMIINKRIWHLRYLIEWLKKLLKRKRDLNIKNKDKEIKRAYL